MKQRFLSCVLGLALLLTARPAQAANVKETAFLITAQVQSQPPEIALQWADIALYDGMVEGKPNGIAIDRKLPADTAWHALDTLPIGCNRLYRPHGGGGGGLSVPGIVVL